MTESDWLKGKDADAMLALVADRLSPRKWQLLSCAMARRLWELLPRGPLQQAISWMESHAGEELTQPQLQEWITKIDAAAPLAEQEARAAQRTAVATADPDAEDTEYLEEDARRAHPAVPLFRAASHAAAAAIVSAGSSLPEEAAQVVRILFTHSGMSRLAQIRQRSVQALINYARAGIEATTALDLKTRGDELADRGMTKNVRLRQAEAIETVNRTTDSTNTRISELDEQKQKGDAKALARFLFEQLGNPFKPYRFEPSWRTEEVLRVARLLDQERTPNHYVDLADALLDADCDEEVILRHCRGTEKHTTEPPCHLRGCWVLDLILETETAFFTAPAITENQKPKPAERLGLSFPGLLDIALADLDGLDDLDLDDEE